MSQERSGPVGRPARYTRSFGGLVGAMVVTVLLVAVYVGFRALIREQPSGRPDAVDYVTDVRALQGSDVDVVYPRSLPDGWTATSTDYQRGTHPQWSIGLLTGDGDFVGLVQQQAPLDGLLKQLVDPHYDHDPDTTVPSELGLTWQTWSDPGGDHGLSVTLPAEAGSAAGQTLLVYGSAPLAEQEDFVRTLTTGALPARSPSAPVTESQ